MNYDELSINSMLKLNIVTQLLAFFVFAILLNFLSMPLLIVIAILFCLILALVRWHQFYRLMRRLLWFYLVMLVIYAFNTPGEHIPGWQFSLSPTFEGLYAGALQLLRIMDMLAALSLLLATNTRQQFISGFYFLFLPFNCLGLSAERFAARLWLTLHYVDVQQERSKEQNSFSHIMERLSSIFDEKEYQEVTIEFEKPSFGLLDIGVILFLAIIISLVLFKAMS